MPRNPPGSVFVYAMACALFLGNRVLEATGLSPPVVSSWLDDLLVMPLALGLVLFLQRRRRRDAKWTLPTVQIVAAVVLYGLFFEVILPRLRSGAVADPWDVAVYAIGALVFQLLINRSGPGWKEASI